MLDLRGGLLSIESAIYIRLSLFWIELNVCAAQDTIPRFSPPFHVIKNSYSAVHISRGLQHRDKALQVSGVPSLLSSVEILDAFTGLSFLIAALTVEPPLRIQWDDDNFPGFGFYPTLHRLLTIQAAAKGKPPADVVQEMCRLGAIFFLAEVRRKFGIAPVVTNVQATKLHNLLDGNEMLWVEELDSVRMWTIIMAGCAADNEADRAWAVKALLRSRVSLVYRNWDEVMDVISEMWWIDEVFRLKSQDLLSEYLKLFIAP
jgi:hypothetical protein